MATSLGRGGRGGIWNGGIMTDLTKITTPYGLLDAETQAALKAHGGPYELAMPENDWIWRNTDGENPLWRRRNVYRVKPSPPKPREWWLARDWTNAGGYYVFDTEPGSSGEIIHVREVIGE